MTDQSPTKIRLLVGFAVLPVVQGVVALAVWPVVWSIGDHGSSRPLDPDGTARAFAILTAALGFLVTVAGAVPAVFTLMRRGPLRLESLLLAGLGLGNAPFAACVFALIPFTIAHLLMGTLPDHLLPISSLLAGAARAVAIGSFFGVLSAAVFWVVAVRGTPR